MARRNSNTQTEQPAEAVEAEAPATEQESTEAPAEQPIDLGPFQQAVNKAVEQKDASTGEVPTEAIGEVNLVYRSLDGIKPKNAAKNWVEDQIKTAIMPPNLDAVTARAYSMVRDGLSAAGAKADKAPADPTQGFVNKVVAHRLAFSLLTPGENVAEDWEAQADKLQGELAEQVTSYKTWLDSEAEDKGEAPEVNPVVRAAFKLAAGKASGGTRSGGSGSGVRRDISKHIDSAFAELESGAFLTVAEIANHTSEEYGNDKPSQGAVSARLFPSEGKKCTLTGVVPVSSEDAPGDKKARGARKV